VTFALEVAERAADVRAALAAVYRELRGRGGGAEDDELEAVLRGPGPHPRPARVCAGLLAVLRELGLAEVEVTSAGGSCRLTEGGPRVELGSSATFVRIQRDLERARAALALEASDLPGGERVARELA
jgi:hypothetical protein